MSTILNRKVIKREFYYLVSYRTGSQKYIVHGSLYLGDGTSILINGNKFILLTEKRKGVILKGTKAYNKIKRMIRIWQNRYRTWNLFSDGVGYWRSRAIDGQHNCNLFRHSNISFKENKSNFLILAS